MAKKIPYSALLLGFFARDKDAFWWKYFTDEELELRRMDAWQLAAVIEEAQVRPGMEKRRIVAEHMLAQRIALIQANASWGAGVLGFVGALLGAALSVALVPLLRPEPPIAIQQPAVPATTPTQPLSTSPRPSTPVLPAPTASSVSTTTPTSAPR